ncbi:U-box domain-containing protein [Acrasis kona]|uniref:U-box domain-containing protein n=1 Tax=Acrasis kona TaxID=1008807 RepID=A0AAW2YTU1_9EUKA
MKLVNRLFTVCILLFVLAIYVQSKTALSNHIRQNEQPLETTTLSPAVDENPQPTTTQTPVVVDPTTTTLPPNEPIPNPPETTTLPPIPEPTTTLAPSPTDATTTLSPTIPNPPETTTLPPFIPTDPTTTITPENPVFTPAPTFIVTTTSSILPTDPNSQIPTTTAAIGNPTYPTNPTTTIPNTHPIPTTSTAPNPVDIGNVTASESPRTADAIIDNQYGAYSYYIWVPILASVLALLLIFFVVLVFVILICKRRAAQANKAARNDVAVPSVIVEVRSPGLPPAPVETLICPMTGKIFFDPVILVENGHTYERGAIERWLETHNEDPVTGKTLASKELKPNPDMKSSVSVFLNSVKQRITY